MPSVFTALLAAVCYGVADFLGGLGSRRAAALPVAALSQVAGAMVLLIVVPLLHPPNATLEGLAWGVAAGTAGACFLSLFYHLLSVGRMSIVAPVSAVWSVIVPVGAGMLFGERPGFSVLSGVLLAIGSTVLLGGGDSDDISGRPALPTGRLVGLSVLAGVFAGLYFVFLERSGDASGLWALLAARVASTILTGVALAVLWRRIRPGQSGALSPSALWPALCSGTLDVLGSLLYVFAIRREMLSVAATLISLYTGVTVLLAWIVLGERFRTRHAAGMACAALAIVLIVLRR